MIKTHELSTREACCNLNLSGSVYHHQVKLNKGDEVIEALQDLVDGRPACGFG